MQYSFFLHFEHKNVLLELSEGHCSIEIMVNKLKLYCYWYRNNPQKCFAMEALLLHPEQPSSIIGLRKAELHYLTQKGQALLLDSVRPSSIIGLRKAKLYYCTQ